MAFIQFDTEQQATLGATAILRLASGPLADDGYMIDPETGFLASAVNVATGEHVPAVTEPETPIQGADSKWYITSPSYADYYRQPLIGSLKVLADRFGIPSDGIAHNVEYRTGREWLVAMWPLLGLGSYDDSHDPEWPESAEFT